MNSEQSSIEAAIGLLVKLHAELPDDSSGRTELKRRLTEKLQTEGHGEIASVLMIYDAVIGARKEMALPNIVYNFQNSQIANANFGTQLGPISASLTALTQKDAGTARFADALKALTESVINAPDLSESQKRDVLDNLGFLGAQAQEPPEKRKSGVLRSVLGSVPNVLTTAASLATIWQTFGPQITTFFGL